jgi:hypothetical protein
MPANSPLAYSPREVSVGVGCLLPPLRYLRSSLFRYLRNCNICLDICFVPLLFSSDTTLPISYSRTNNSSVGSWGGRSYGCRSGGKLQSCWYVHIYVYIFYISVCLRLFFKHLCANELGGLGLTHSTQVSAFVTKRACNALHHFPLSAFLWKKIKWRLCVCVRACSCACVYLCASVSVHVCACVRHCTP